ncbi:EAL domain-containing protein [Candidatus Magnetobacterium casensis]|uniref:EAL domain-containing protein n=2 Tax=Candidatus Magnetobacterium casense TaxID=1455061 RepID=A0ABS6RZ12_9BACT|nr:EAL domain-containing protein [Candidatus Magnetobacterium casensis]
MIDVLKGKGYKIAIDDFGAGYGGLKMLSIIEPDFVKIDRHFISNMDKALVKYNLVDAIATACHRLGIKVIAEGIETEHELRLVVNMDIELLQGFLLKRPSPMLERDIASVCSVFNRQDVEDLDNFKPYNDNYGFEKGDNVIGELARIMEGVRDAEADNFSFVGHIGGDDFILITRPRSSFAMCNLIIERFRKNLCSFHGDEDCNRGFYHAKNRKGEMERFELLSLSIGIVSTEVYKIESFAQLASLSSDVKKAAKSKPGFSIVRDRRMEQQIS